MNQFIITGKVLNVENNGKQIISVEILKENSISGGYDKVKITVPNYIKTDVLVGENIFAKGKISKTDLIVQNLYILKTMNEE